MHEVETWKGIIEQGHDLKKKGQEKMTYGTPITDCWGQNGTSEARGSEAHAIRRKGEGKGGNRATSKAARYPRSRSKQQYCTFGASADKNVRQG